MTPNRLPLLMFLFIGLVVVAVVGMSTGSWLWFGIALAAHLIASTIVLTGAFRSSRTGEESDPHSEGLDRRAGEAVGDRPRNIETELEALKRK
jgi:membrane protein implicated in regulation of membrane protease activity